MLPTSPGLCPNAQLVLKINPFLILGCVGFFQNYQYFDETL